MLVPGGLLFAAAISRFASALDGLAQDLFADPEFHPIVRRALADGIHENRTVPDPLLPVASGSFRVF